MNSLYFECLICKNKKYNFYYKNTRENDHHKIVKCKKCNHIQLYPLDFNAKEYYDHDKQDKSITNIGNRKNEEWLEMVNNQSKRRINYLSEVIKSLLQKKETINICDIGGGYGHFCRNIKEKYGEKINVTLIEPGNSRINKYNNNNNIKLIESLINENIIQEHFEEYDIVTCFHVFEHVFEPVKFIKLLKQLVKEDGYYCIEVPNQNNELVKLSEPFKEKVWYLNCHVSYFTPEKLLSLVKDEKNQLIEFKGFERYGLFNFLYWLYYNESQKSRVDYYNGNSLHEIEDIWIEKRNKNMISDSMYVIIQK